MSRCLTALSLLYRWDITNKTKTLLPGLQLKRPPLISNVGNYLRMLSQRLYPFFLKQYRHQVPRGSRWTVICISHPSRAVSPPQSPTHFGEGELFTADCDPVTLVPSEMKFHDSLHNFSAILRWREVVWKWGSRWFGNNFGVVYDARFVLERYLHGSEVGSGCAYNSN